MPKKKKNNNNDQLRVGVIGMGPVGAILAAHLIEAGAYVVPCDIIPKKIDKIKKSGIRLVNIIEKRVEVVDTCHSIQELGVHDLDVVVIASKAPSLPKIVEKLSEIETKKMHIVCAQNGIDNEQEVTRVFGDDKTLRMVINYAGSTTDHNITHVAFFNPPNYLAPLAPKGEPIAKKLVKLLNSADLKTVIPEDIQDYVWAKAILNAALSGVCAITRKTMKEVMDFQKTVGVVEALIDESVAVAKKEGIELDKKFRRYSIKYLKNAGHHRPSMLIDLENGNQTEVDFLNGKIVKYGQKHYVPTPLNQLVTALVHLLEFSVD